MSRSSISADVLSFTRFQKEASLIVYHDDDERRHCEGDLQKEHYVEAPDAPKLFHSIQAGEKVYIVLTKHNAKAVYDVALQYPTGQVSVRNADTVHTEWADPDYSRGSLIVIADAALIKELETRGLLFRAITGLAVEYPHAV